MVGTTYTYKLYGSTATSYEQLEGYLTFPTDLFRVVSAHSDYSAGASRNTVYADACGWQPNPSATGYRSCLGTGKAGGDVVITYTVLAIAKGPDRNAGRERFHRPGRASFILEPKDPVLYFLQRLRDEAHRFAIGTHRARRGKGITASPLDEIPGIGARRKRALLQHFGSAKAVAQAGPGDLEAVAGISGAVARKIYGHFHDEA